MRTPSKLLMRRTKLSLLIAGLATQPVSWADVPIAQYPAGTMSRKPAPNVIVTVDDSGSMLATGIATLKAALRDAFSTTNLEDGQVRLGWQSMHRCLGLPSASADCGGKNAVKVFSGQHRTNFMTWVDTLTHGGGTPSHRVVRSAGDYLSKTDLGINSPWASEPGVTEMPILSCRKSYHLFMTDGGWNGSASSTADIVDGDRKTTSYKSNELVAPNGNIDGSARILPDGTSYDPTSNQTRLYADTWGFSGTSGLNTLADLAFYYWATDLQPGLANDVPPPDKDKDLGDKEFSSGTTRLTLSAKWRPESNPATWQHMVTYTIGFGAGATGWTGDPVWGGGTHQGAGFDKLVLGLNTWPSPLCANNTACDGATLYGNRDNQRKVELWHMALNGRGLFVPAPTSTSLGPAFKTIIDDIRAGNSEGSTSAASSSTSLASNGSDAFAAGYKAAKWSGAITASTLAAGSGAHTPAWGGASTAEKLDALTDLSTRLILTWREGSTSPAVDGATVFKWANDQSRLSTAQKLLLYTASGTTAEAATEGEARLNYLRGDRTREKTSPLFRERASRQGDIVNSRVWYTAQPASNYSFEGYSSFASAHQHRLPMVYAGGNDGMLHGFSGETGDEKIAYVPKGVMANLRLLTQPSYNNNHRYFVDGSPFTGDVNWGTKESPSWRTLLVGSLGAGGKGYFVLDVTTPGSKANQVAPASNFAENYARALVVMDRTTPIGAVTATPGADGKPVVTTTSAEAHIGQITAPPVVDDTNPFVATQITRLNDGKWALVMGNGYNSSAGRPALLIQYLDGTTNPLIHIPVDAPSAAGDGNGLSAPRVVDLDGDGRTDVVYAGDLKGNVWKFNLLGSDNTKWNVAFNGAPLYTATHTRTGSTTAVAQPITAPPIVRANTRGGTGVMVAFGTGRNLTTTDRSDTAPQTLYSVLDGTVYHFEEKDGKRQPLAIKTEGMALGTGVGKLVQQTTSAVTAASGRNYDVLSANTVGYDGKDAKSGWYLHFPVSGERLLDAMSFYNATNILEVVSEVPADGSEERGETCTPPPPLARYFRTFINIMDGKAPSFQVVDLDGRGYFNAEDQGVSRLELKGPPGLKLENVCHLKGCPFKVDKRDDDFHAKPPILSLRPNWRQLR